MGGKTTKPAAGAPLPLGPMDVRLWGLVLAITACSCHRDASRETPPPATTSAGSARPTSITEAHVQLFERMIASMTTLAPKLDAAGDDCALVIDTLKKAADPALVEDMSAAPDLTADAAARDWFKARYADRVEPAMASLTRVTKQCNEHPDLEAAILGLGFRKQR